MLTREWVGGGGGVCDDIYIIYICTGSEEETGPEAHYHFSYSRRRQVLFLLLRSRKHFYTPARTCVNTITCANSCHHMMMIAGRIWGLEGEVQRLIDVHLN